MLRSQTLPHFWQQTHPGIHQLLAFCNSVVTSRQWSTQFWDSHALTINQQHSHKLLIETPHTDYRLTFSSPAVSNGYTSKCSWPYWSNAPFNFFDTLALWHSRLSARVLECQKIKNGGLDQYGAGQSGRLIFATIRKSVELKGLTNTLILRQGWGGQTFVQRATHDSWMWSDGQTFNLYEFQS